MMARRTTALSNIVVAPVSNATGLRKSQTPELSTVVLPRTEDVEELWSGGRAR
jgi:hypothetical protein